MQKRKNDLNYAGSIDPSPPIQGAEQRAKVVSAFEAIRSKNSFTVVEGTGHCGVGSIVNLSNAQVGKKNLLIMTLEGVRWKVEEGKKVEEEDEDETGKG